MRRSRRSWSRLLERDPEPAEHARGDGVGNAEHPEQDVLVVQLLVAGVVDRLRERSLQPRADSEAAGARSLERTWAERLLEASTHRVEVDPEFRQRVRVDLRG